MQEIEMKSAAGDVVRGACYGKWSRYHPACSDCMVWTDCQRITEKTKRVAAKKAQEEADPVAYLLGLLRKKYSEERKFGEGVCGHLFKNKNGEKVVAVFVAEDGKVKIQSAGGLKVFKKLESADMVRNDVLTDDVMKDIV